MLKTLKVVLITLGLSYCVLSGYSQTKEKPKKSKKDKVAQIIDAIPQDLLSKEIKEAKNIASAPAPQEGITYKVISTRTVNTSDCWNCPANIGTGKPCYAKAIVESREYSEWKQGQVVRIWTSDVSFFAGCGWN